MYPQCHVLIRPIGNKTFPHHSEENFDLSRSIFEKFEDWIAPLDVHRAAGTNRARCTTTACSMRSVEPMNLLWCTTLREPCTDKLLCFTRATRKFIGFLWSLGIYALVFTVNIYPRGWKNTGMVLWGTTGRLRWTRSATPSSSRLTEPGPSRRRRTRAELT